ncbi:uncharacterized protein LOC118152946 [Callithrix jacchus]
MHTDQSFKGACICTRTQVHQTRSVILGESRPGSGGAIRAPPGSWAAETLSAVLKAKFLPLRSLELLGAQTPRADRAAACKRRPGRGGGERRAPVAVPAPRVRDTVSGRKSGCERRAQEIDRQGAVTSGSWLLVRAQHSLSSPAHPVPSPPHSPRPQCYLRFLGGRRSQSSHFQSRTSRNGIGERQGEGESSEEDPETGRRRGRESSQELITKSLVIVPLGEAPQSCSWETGSGRRPFRLRAPVVLLLPTCHESGGSIVTVDAAELANPPSHSTLPENGQTDTPVLTD